MALGIAGCESGEPESDRITPEGIRGEWATNDARYADRKLEILSEALLFYTGGRAFDPYIIHHIQTEPADDGTRYIIEHSGAEMGRMTTTFLVYPGDTALVFQNQPHVIWRKVDQGEGS
jgi:hypothetical protein